MSKWTKLGNVFMPCGNIWWMHSHITPLSAIVLEDRIRVFICSRCKPDERGNYISYTSFIDVEKSNPVSVLYVHDKPLLPLGGYGTFDEFGTMVTSAVSFGNNVHLYYAGWQRLGGQTAAYQVMCGLAISNDYGYSFNKFSEGPIVGIDTFDPISIGNVAVIKDTNEWRMYYTSLSEWVLGGNKPAYEYVIKYAHSTDGVLWSKTGDIVVDKVNGYGVATPTVLKCDDKYHMWFGYRKVYEGMHIGGYKMGYASSLDGKLWQRNDSLYNIAVSSDGWDSQMVCYPDVVQIGERVYMFYCGNEFGRTGFGVAMLEGNLA